MFHHQFLLKLEKKTTLIMIDSDFLQDTLNIFILKHYKYCINKFKRGFIKRSIIFVIAILFIALILSCGGKGKEDRNGDLDNNTFTGTWAQKIILKSTALPVTTTRYLPKSLWMKTENLL